jgi:SP family xylose:H+ symportor-like MFS transporter
VALAGFLFGFDTVVISGANEPIKALWETSSWFHGLFIMSMALWGTVLGSLYGSVPCDKLGRKKTLFWIGILYLVSALGSALAVDPYTFSAFRFIGGLGVGASSVAAPAYLSEISSAKNRGKLVAMYQFNLVLGILLAFISNYLLKGFGGINDWRYMLGIEAIPAVLYTLLVLRIPNSPRWLVMKGRIDEALIVLKTMWPSEGKAEALLEEIQAHFKTGTLIQEKLFQKKYYRPLLLAFLLAAFNQLSGINFVLYYAPVILENAGFASTDSLLSSVSIGVVNLVFTMFGLALIDRLGRKTLMYIGSVGYILGLTMISYGFYTDASPMFNLSFILLFIASHAIGQGAVIWVFIAEIFPNAVRAKGQSFGTGVHWVLAAAITLLGEVVIEAFPGWIIFAFFAFFMILQLLFTHFLMPETSGKALESLEDEVVDTVP